MNSRGGPREEVIDEIARLLPQQTGQLGRLLWRSAGGPLHRSMAILLATVGDGPHTIGRLAEIEGVAQPTVTRMVIRLEAEGLVRRERTANDGRVVHVILTPKGVTELAALRKRYTDVLQARLADLPDRSLEELRRASAALQVLVDALRDHERLLKERS